jgi:hypothetical protein
MPISTIVKWARLIVGLTVTIAGAALFYRPCEGLIRATTMSLELAQIYALLLTTGLLTIVAGVHIANVKD